MERQRRRHLLDRRAICELRTERMYENFVLDVEWMHLTPKGNAGVFIWADPLPARGQPFLRAIEVQVLDGRETPNYTSHGDIFPIHGAKMTPNHPHPGGWDRSLPTEKRAKPAGQWNHYRITADRGRITLEVNGKAVSGGYDITPRKGYIALESEGAPAMFRNLRIRELPSAGELAATESPHADEGYRSLYTGVDLSGWTSKAPRDALGRPTGRSQPRARRWDAEDGRRRRPAAHVQRRACWLIGAVDRRKRTSSPRRRTSPMTVVLDPFAGVATRGFVLVPRSRAASGRGDRVEPDPDLAGAARVWSWS